MVGAQIILLIVQAGKWKVRWVLRIALARRITRRGPLGPSPSTSTSHTQYSFRGRGQQKGSAEGSHKEVTDPWSRAALLPPEGQGGGVICVDGSSRRSSNQAGKKLYFSIPHMADSELHPIPFTGSQRLILHLSQEELAGTWTVTGVPEGRI